MQNIKKKIKFIGLNKPEEKIYPTASLFQKNHNSETLNNFDTTSMDGYNNFRGTSNQSKDFEEVVESSKVINQNGFFDLGSSQNNSRNTNNSGTNPNNNSNQNTQTRSNDNKNVGYQQNSQYNNNKHNSFESTTQNTDNRQSYQSATDNLDLPKFLTKNQFKSQGNNQNSTNHGRKRIDMNQTNQTNSSPKALTYLSPQYDQDPGSFTSTFSNDNQKVENNFRVFQKTLLFMALQLISYFALIFAFLTGGVNNIFALPFNLYNVVTNNLSISSLFSSLSGIVLVGILTVIYTTFSCLFAVIVADRIYVWVSLLVQLVSLIFCFSFLGLGFTLPTILVSILCASMFYFGYLEIEKIQVSSRLFNIQYITNESVKLFTQIAMLTATLVIFNTIIFESPKNFLVNRVLTNEYATNFLVEKKPLLKGDYTVDKTKDEVLNKADKQPLTIVDFLTLNYDLGINQKCIATETESKCDLKAEKLQKVVKLIEANYNDNSVNSSIFKQKNIEEPLNQIEFKQLLKEFYVQKFSVDISKGLDRQEFAFIGKLLGVEGGSWFLPAIAALFFYILMVIIKPILHFIANIFIWIIWKTMILTGFTKVNVELVESEIISI
jgi:hypothetical protein